MSLLKTFNKNNAQQRWLEMVKAIDLNEAVRNFRQLLKDVSRGTNNYIVKDKGREMAVIISLSDFKSYTQRKEQSKKRFFEMVDKIRERNKDVPFKQIEKDVAQAVSEVKQMELERLEQ